MKPITNDNIIVACYYRYSSDMQTEDSIEAQRAGCIRYCELNGWPYQEELEYIDRAKSGSSTVNRTNFRRMLADAGEKKFNILLVHKMDRFSRSILTGGIAKNELETNGVKIRSASENIDDTPLGKFAANLLACMSEYYIDNLSSEVHKVMDQKASKGLFLGGTPPLGFCINTVDGEKVYAIDEDEAQIVRDIFSMFVDLGCGYSRIAKILNSEGKKTKYGNEFCQNAVREIILNQKYIGVYEWNKRVPKNKLTGKRNHHAYKDASKIIRIEGALPQIISHETFAKAQLKIRKNTGVNQNKMSHKAKEVYLLRGKLFCGSCGRQLTGNRRSGGRNKKSVYSSYNCPRVADSVCMTKGLKKEAIEKAAADIILAQLTDGNLEQVAQRVNEYRKEKESPNASRARKLRSEISDIDFKINNILDFIMAGNAPAVLNNRLQELERTKGQFQTDLSSIEAETQALTFDISTVKTKAQAIMERLKEKNPARLEEIFDAFIERINVNEADIEICLSLAYLFAVFEGGLRPPQPLSPKTEFSVLVMLISVFCFMSMRSTSRCMALSSGQALSASSQART